MSELHFYNEENLQIANRAFLMGDAVNMNFFVNSGKLIMAEECYFFLMASMRKMRMNIPLTYTLEFFQNLISEKIAGGEVDDAIVHFHFYRKNDHSVPLHKAEIFYYMAIKPGKNILQISGTMHLDLLKEINVNTNLLSNIRVHSPENIYAEIYAKENDLDEVILLNPNKRIARAISGNLLFLEGGTIKIPKQSEGAYISPLMENFVTFVHKNRLVEIQEAEMVAFESQKANEILLISDQKGIFSVSQIRNKNFSTTRFLEMVTQWRASFREV